MNPTLQLLLAALTGAALLALGAAGMAAASRPSRATERSLARMQAISERRQDHYLNLLLARSPEHLGWLTGIAAAPPVQPDPVVAGPPERPTPWDAAAEDFTADPHEADQWDVTDDAAFAGLRS